jgi:prepilin-type N-terminal cleavage/methylation domain-containing protein
MRKDQMKLSHGNRGMSLVELMMVMAILSVVMMAVMSLYIPALQSTAAQTQVSDVQSNLRLATNRMTKDLLIAGFLVPINPVVFPDYNSAGLSGPGTPGSATEDFTIRTRAVGNTFARVASAANVSGDIRITVTTAAMADLFPVGSKVRLFEPVTANEIKAGSGSDSDRVYTVTTTGTGTIDIDPGTIITTADVPAETVVLKVRDNSQPPIQTIRYRLNNGALERIVNNNIQFLARNMDSVNFTFDLTDQDRVRRVDIVLTGITRALRNDAISGAKSRQVETSVSLRNIY